MKSAQDIIAELAWSGNLPLTAARRDCDAIDAAILILKGKEDELSGRVPFQEAPYRMVKHARKYLEEAKALESGLKLLAEAV